MRSLVLVIAASLACGASAQQASTITDGNIVVGFNLPCGGTISDIHSPGLPNVVNNADCTGRQIQVALYDGSDTYDDCAGCHGIWGWNPVQGGDRWGHGSPVLASSISGASAYIKTRPLEWLPDGKGGGLTVPIQSDIELEQWVDIVGGAIKVRYKVTHLGTDTHTSTVQEWPAVYTNVGYDYVWYYGGSQPWTFSPLLAFNQWPGLSASNTAFTETWASNMDPQGYGLMVYIPKAYPWFQGTQFPGPTGANYFHPWTPFEVGPNAVIDGTVWMLFQFGVPSRDWITYKHAEEVPSMDLFAPMAALDSPAVDATVSGIIPVGGWAIDNVGVQFVTVKVDGVTIGQATLGGSRPDIPAVYPTAPSNGGFFYPLDTTALTNGLHFLDVVATDAQGHAAPHPPRPIHVNNGGSDTTAPVVTLTLKFDVTATATDNVGVTSAQVLIDGQLLTSFTSPYHALLTLGPGTHTFTVTAQDAAGNTASVTK